MEFRGNSMNVPEHFVLDAIRIDSPCRVNTNLISGGKAQTPVFAGEWDRRRLASLPPQIVSTTLVLRPENTPPKDRRGVDTARIGCGRKKAE